MNILSIKPTNTPADTVLDLEIKGRNLEEARQVLLVACDPLPPNKFEFDRTAGETDANRFTANVELNGAKEGKYSVLVLDEDGITSNNLIRAFEVQKPSVVEPLPIVSPPLVPEIITQPVSQTVKAGENAKFTAAACGQPSLSYQWYKDAITPVGVNAACLILNAVGLADDGGRYSVVVSNSAGAVTSAPATLTVKPVPPSISVQPACQDVAEGAAVVFKVTATGNPPPAFQWQKDGAAMSGETRDILTLAKVALGDAGSYAVVISNSAGLIVSTAAMLKVNPAPVKPSITTAPVGPTVTAGDPVSFSVVATGDMPLSYQWRKNGADITGATAPTLLLAAVTREDVGVYTAMVTNSAGTIVSKPAKLTVNSAPVKPSITTDPVDRTAMAGTDVRFTVRVAGTKPLSYQWRKNGADITGATTPALLLAAVTRNDEGVYTAMVTNSAGSIVSKQANLKVNPKLSITVNPPNYDVQKGGKAKFTAEPAGGRFPYKYKWYKGSKPLRGKNHAALAFTKIQKGQAGNYMVKITDADGSSVKSAPARLTVG